MRLAASLLLALISTSSIANENLTVDDFFPRRSFWGKSPQALEWSKNDRYLAYGWNKIDEPGYDIWVYDSQSGDKKRLTSPDTFKPFDKDLEKALKLHQENVENAVKSEGMTEADYREFLQKERDKQEKKQKEIEKGGDPDPVYTGPSGYAWSNTSDDLLITYKGDIYRLTQDGKATRLTWTRDSENNLKYLPDDSGFTFRRGDGVFLMRWDSPNVRQLNPRLPNRLPLGSYSISPDGTKLMITSFKETSPTRQVDYITYRDRFATARKTSRGVADDKFNQESYIFLYDLTEELKGNDLADQKPWEVYKFPGGEELWSSAVHAEPWSPDSSQFVFSVSKRDQGLLDIVVADLAKRETKTVYSTRINPGEWTSGETNAFFLPDNRRIIATLDSSGFKHPHLIDPSTSGAVQITRGDYETIPLRATPDGKSLLVYSAKADPARRRVYSADIESGIMQMIGEVKGNYGNPEAGHDGTRFASTIASWSDPSELYVYTGGKQTKLTDSHRIDRFKKANAIQPELFTYQNRHGQVIRAYMFKPEGWKATDKRPLMVYVYGGPTGTPPSVVDGKFQSSSYWFSQFLVRKHGFVAITIDPRGESGYGSAHAKANWEKPGVPQVEDLVDGVKFMTKHYGIDPERVGINGWSFGGFQTQLCLYTAPDVFKLGIAGAGPTEWQNYNTWYTGAVIGNAADGKPEDLDKYSLTHLAKNLQSPLLLLHGMEDTNVLFQDTVKQYRKLLQYGKGHLVELALDPTGGHGMGGDMSNRDMHMIYYEFIKRRWRL
jgi:dipeptidyl-peptidase-4